MANTPLPISPAQCGGGTIGQSQPVQLTTYSAKRYQRIVNNGPGNLWLTRDPLTTVSVGGAGCWQLTPGQDEEYPTAGTPYVPQLATYGVSDGTCTVAVEVN